MFVFGLADGLGQLVFYLLKLLLRAEAINFVNHYVAMFPFMVIPVKNIIAYYPQDYIFPKADPLTKQFHVITFLSATQVSFFFLVDRRAP